MGRRDAAVQDPAEILVTGLVLWFYGSAGAAVCSSLACSLRDAFEAFDAADTTLVGVSPDAPNVLAKFEETHRLSFRLLSDINRVVGDAYGAYEESLTSGRTYLKLVRCFFVIDQAGCLTAAHYRVMPKETVLLILQALELGDLALEW